MSEQGQFDLCPKCGGIARDGICQSCGYEIPGIQDAIGEDEMKEQGQPEAGEKQPVDEAPTKQQTQDLPHEDVLYVTPDVYQTQSGQDLYHTPDVNAEHCHAAGMFSGEQADNGTEPEIWHKQDANAQNQYEQGQYSQYQNPQEQYGQNRYGQDQWNQNQYNQGQYGQSQYNQVQYGQNEYNRGQYGQSQYNQGQYGQNEYNRGQYGQNEYNQGQYGQSQYGQGQYGQNQYNQNQYTQSQYSQNPYGNPPYGNNQFANNPYSPYATPPAKKHTGLIIGVIITVAVLFFVALFALVYHALEVFSKMKDSGVDTDHVEEFYREYFDDDFYDDNYGDRDDYGYNDYYDDDYYDDYYYDDYYDDDYYHDYDNDEYYTLHDDLKEGLSYSIEWGDYEYEPDDADVIILVEYPIIVGDDIPNLDKINELFANEVSVFQEYYDEEYSGYMTDEDSYFYVSAMGYVTYMDEDVLSVVFHENVYSDYYDSAYLYSINIDMRDGVVLDNTDIIAVNDEFSIDFRYRSDEQNGTIDALDMMSDQEITEYLANEDNAIIFYTPQGMEIGFNYEEGWVTVTYRDYKDYLNIF